MYYTSAITSIGLAIAATCVVLNFYYKKTKMPAWLRRLVLGKLASCIRIETKFNQKKRQLQTSDQVIANSSTIENESEPTQFGVTLKSINHRRRQSHEAPDSETDIKAENDMHTNGMSNGNLSRHCSSVKDKHGSKEQVSSEETVEEECEREWRTASRVIDRVVLVTGMVVAIITSGTIFLQAPRVRDALVGKDDL